MSAVTQILVYCTLYSGVRPQLRKFGSGNETYLTTPFFILQCVVLAAPGFYLLPAFCSYRVFCDVPTMLSNSSGVTIFNHAVFAVTNGVSVLVCLLAAILVLRLKLCKILVYRLALYQVLSALVMASVQTMQVVFINYEQSPNIYGRICITIAMLLIYTEWMKLLFTMWVIFHLFCFAVLHRNLKKLEVLYVVTSLLVPAVIAVVPLVTHSYGLNPDGDVCNMYANTSVAFIERLALWDGPAMLVLIASSIAMVVMVIKLANQVCRSSKYEPITDGNQFWKALKQLLPLATFPMLFFIFEIPVLMFHVYTSQQSTPNEALFLANVVCFSLWSMASGATVIVHISVSQICGRKRKPTCTSKPVRECRVNVSDAHP